MSDSLFCGQRLLGDAENPPAGQGSGWLTAPPFPEGVVGRGQSSFSPRASGTAQCGWEAGRSLARAWAASGAPSVAPDRARYESGRAWGDCPTPRPSYGVEYRTRGVKTFPPLHQSQDDRSLSGETPGSGCTPWPFLRVVCVSQDAPHSDLLQF